MLSLAQATLASAGISAGSNLLGGILGSSEAKKSRKMAKRQFAAQMDESIQRRVADAKKAGVHPLFALGASAGASPTSQAFGTPMGDALAAAGEAVGQGVTGYAQARAQQRREELLLQSQLEKDRAAIDNDYAQAGLHEAQTARINQELMSVGRDQSALEAAGLVTFPDRPRIPVSPGVPYVTEKGRRQVAGERQMMATPTHNVYKLPFGFELHTESGFTPGEALEQHYGDIGSAPWQVAMLIEDALAGRVRNPTLERWLRKAGSQGRRWMERELWKIETRMQKRRKK